VAVSVRILVEAFFPFGQGPHSRRGGGPAWRLAAGGCTVTSRRDLGLGEVLGLRSGFDPPDLDRPAGPGPGPALSTRRVGNPW
jgi:hypothetical protein